METMFFLRTLSASKDLGTLVIGAIVIVDSTFSRSLIDVVKFSSIVALNVFLSLSSVPFLAIETLAYTPSFFVSCASRMSGGSLGVTSMRRPLRCLDIRRLRATRMFRSTCSLLAFVESTSTEGISVLEDTKPSNFSSSSVVSANKEMTINKSRFNRIKQVIEEKVIAFNSSLNNANVYYTRNAFLSFSPPRPAS